MIERDEYSDDELFDDDNIYDDDVRDDLLDNDELSSREAGFIDGYEDSMESMFQDPPDA